MHFELSPSNRNCSDDELLHDVRTVAEKLKSPSVTIAEYKSHGRFSPSTVIRRFGTWPQTLKLAELEVRNFNGGVLPDDALADLVAVASRLGVSTLTQAAYRAHGKWSARPLITHYGSWLKALRAAGLQHSRAYRLSDEELFDNLEQVWRALGRKPNYDEIAKPLSKYAAATYAQRFGSWRQALEGFVASVANLDRPQGPKVDTGVETRAQPTVRRKTTRAIGYRLRFLVLRKDNFRCRLCGASPVLHPEVALQVDHIVPWSNGGETVFENLQTTCLRCNIGKSDLSIEEKANKAPEPTPGSVTPRATEDASK